jgi:hypothetical protein
MEAGKHLHIWKSYDQMHSSECLMMLPKIIEDDKLYQVPVAHIDPHNAHTHI